MPAKANQPKIDFPLISREINKIQSRAPGEHIPFIVQAALFTADRLEETRGIK